MVDRSKFKPALIEVVYKDIITTEFSELKKYLCEHFENHQSRKNTLDNIIKENRDSDFIDGIIDDYNDYHNFDQILYSSQIVIIYSHLEFWMSKIAKKIEQRTNSKVKLNDLSESSDLERAKKFINIVGDVELSDLNTQWTEILEFRTIRHLIVHNGYNLFKHQIIKKNEKDFTKQEKDGLRIIKHNERLSVNLETGVIVISDLNYPLRFCGVCQTFLHSLLDNIIKKYSS
jgi:hypothetical protein